MQGLLGNSQYSEQSAHPNIRVTAHKIENAMVHALQTACFQQLIWLGGKGTEGKME